MPYMLQRRAWTSMDAVTTHMQRGLISCVARGSWTSARAITASIVALLCGVHARGLRIGQLSILRHSLWLHLSNVGIYPAISARGRYQYLCTPGWLRGRYRFAVADRQRFCLSSKKTQGAARDTAVQSTSFREKK
jgi:hypothetical protein